MVRLLHSMREHTTDLFLTPRLDKPLILVECAIDREVGAFVFVFCTNERTINLFVFLGLAV